MVEITDETHDGPHGALPVRIYQPAEPATAGLVWMHGGAYAGGDLDMPESDQVALELARRGTLVVAVDYRLAPLPEAWAREMDVAPWPGVHFPVPVDEVEHAFRRAQAKLSSVRWSIGGASAGAALAAAATLRLRHDQPPWSVVLAYPVVHAELPPLTAEIEDVASTVPPDRRFSPERVRTMSANYLGPRPEGAAHGAPAFAGGANLVGFPRTLVINSEADDLRASGQLFASELALAGVDVAQVLEVGALHGHLNDQGSALALRSIDRIARWLAGAVGLY